MRAHKRFAAWDSLDTRYDCFPWARHPLHHPLIMYYDKTEGPSALRMRNKTWTNLHEHSQWYVRETPCVREFLVHCSVSKHVITSNHGGSESYTDSGINTISCSSPYGGGLYGSLVLYSGRGSVLVDADDASLRAAARCFWYTSLGRVNVPM